MSTSSPVSGNLNPICVENPRASSEGLRRNADFAKGLAVISQLAFFALNLVAFWMKYQFGLILVPLSLILSVAIREKSQQKVSFFETAARYEEGAAQEYERLQRLSPTQLQMQYGSLLINPVYLPPPPATTYAPTYAPTIAATTFAPSMGLTYDAALANAPTLNSFVMQTASAIAAMTSPPAFSTVNRALPILARRIFWMNEQRTIETDLQNRYGRRINQEDLSTLESMRLEAIRNVNYLTQLMVEPNHVDENAMVYWMLRA